MWRSNLSRSKSTTLVVCALFLALGIVMLTTAVAGPAVQMIQARNWQPTECRVVAARLDGQKGTRRTGRCRRRPCTRYCVRVNYLYHFAGQEWIGTRHDFAERFSTNRQTQQAILARYRPGTQTTCYVNPAMPGEAVLERGMSNDFRFEAGLCLALCLGGAVGLGIGLAPRRPDPEREDPASAGHDECASAA